MKVSYRVDTFKDYVGGLRHFVIAAVSLPVNAVIEEFGDDEYAFEPDHTEDCGKVLLLGFSACQSCDTFNEEIGKKIALGKALKNREYALYATNKGLINSGMIESLLDQEVKFFKKDPGYYLKGYRDAERRFNKVNNVHKFVKSLNEKDLEAFKWLKETKKSWRNQLIKLAEESK